VHADPERIAQVLGQLVSNAIKFSEHGAVTLRVRREESVPPMLRFEVVDQGIGIPVEQHARMFQLFDQGDSTTTRRFGGTGLGLQLCKRPVKLMAGEIGFSSRPGEGSAFWFTVPLRLSTDKPADSVLGAEVLAEKPAIDAQQLLSLLEQGEMQAKTLWAKNPHGLDSLLGHTAAAFATAMAAYDFERACELLKDAISPGERQSDALA
jgi:hypothetical protein